MRSRNDNPPSRKLIIGNIANDVSQNEFFDFLSEFGELEDATLWIDFETGDSRGFGFVTFVSQYCADVAVKRLHFSYWRGRRITVKYARPEG